MVGDFEKVLSSLLCQFLQERLESLCLFWAEKFLHYLIFSPKADHSIMFYLTKLKIFTDDVVVVVDHSTLCHYVR